MATPLNKQIAAQLKALPKADAAAFAAQIAALHQAGLKTIRVFPKGIPIFDGVTVSSIVKQSELAGIIQKLAGKLPVGGGLEIFPFGIPRPDVFNINVHLK